MKLRALLASAVLLALLTGLAAAQPYAAEGGFDRPRVAFDLSRASLAAAVDEGRARLLIGDANGLRLIDLVAGTDLRTAPTTVLAERAVIRGVAAADGVAGGPAAYAWFERDPRSGAYHYTWRWGEREQPLARTSQALEMALVMGDEGPEAFLALPTAEGGRLERYRWDASAPETMIRSERSLAAPTVARDPEGSLHLAYLEGTTVETPIGLSAEWEVVYRAPDGREWRFPDALGPPAAITLDAADPVVLLWLRSDATLVAIAPQVEAAPQTLGAGRPVGIAAARAFWTRGATIVATGLATRAASDTRPVNVAWSPYTVERATLTNVDGVTHLAWSGTLPGGAGVALSSDDAEPLRASWRDHVAAWFGWTPWALREEALGQLTGALLVGVLGTMVLLPLFWVLTLPLARRVPERWARLAGALVAASSLLVLALLAAFRAAGLGNDVALLLGGYWGFGLAVAVGLLVAPLALARVDLETQPALLASAGIAGFVILSLASFIAFQPWLQLFGL